jgi:hypothetical protein
VVYSENEKDHIRHFKSLRDITTISILRQTLEMHLRNFILEVLRTFNWGKKYPASLVKSRNHSTLAGPNKRARSLSFFLKKMVTYYRRFVTGLTHIYVPLFDLLKNPDAEIRKKYRKIPWTTSAKTTFRELKTRLTTESVLLQPDTTTPFTIETDASE